MIGLLTSTTVMTAASVLGYNAIAPRSQLFGKTFTDNKRHEKQLALTFDDGPNDRSTPALLELLDKHGVKATFFMIGRHVAAHPEIARAAARAGHVIGNHTATHLDLIFCSGNQVRAQLLACREALESAVGEHSTLFRPPYGRRRPQVIKIASELGFSTVMWSVMAYDWQPSPAWKIEANVARQITSGDVILLHDGGHLGLGADRSQTIAATDAIIRQYLEQGFSFVTVPQIME
jgi:peptidoglycan/xylan/chitin deacetylase (PgdA/CDA1 family)